MAGVLRGLGATVTLDAATVTIESPAEPSFHADFDAVKQFRASVCVLGPLMSRCRRAVVALPVGDAIGSRPLDMHQAGLRAMGAHSSIEHGCVVASAERLTGAPIALEFPSVGATENILMAAVLADGETTVDNAAREPEIVDLCEMLTQMGAQIDGAGTSTLTVTRVRELKPTTHRVVGDRIVGATWGIAAAMTRGDVTVRGVAPQHLSLVLTKLADAGAKVDWFDDGFRVQQEARPVAINVSTLPYPGFPTDLQPMVIGLATIADGMSVVTENVIEARFRFVEEMVRLGADAQQPAPRRHADDIREGKARGAGGQNGSQIDDTDIKGKPADKTGIYALEKADLFNILCIPPVDRAGDIEADVYAEALKYCGDRRAMLFIDSPSSWKSVITVWGQSTPDRVLMRAVKEKLDPGNVYNPGRFVDGI